ncbi:hypothetical protein OM076_33065 [Solirubrobacter ginsenosidimutans]|uniref:Uncharacterized protein n=1 Tax=Solirubrobacter ginsenosidimutans TaxID=490573 RepID=A0A9X3MZ19_9ACTN|nr:hypothetical protein [Solirubrobacter ginsenosidimutans]MDA0165147.1 hypothetical protein [Solirubrobacter ginsenosidimutans]
MNPQPPQYTRRPTGGRLALVIIGALVATASLAILAGAIVLHWANGKSDAGGFFNTAYVRIAAGTYAVTSENVQIDEGFLDVVGADRLRLRVRSNTNRPVFVGVARPAQVSAYLGDAGRAVLQDVEFAPFNPTYLTSGSSDASPAPPTKEDFWLAQVTGTGTQTVDWDSSGRWEVVLMNADAARGIDASVSAGAQAKLVGRLAWIVSVAGLVVLAFGVLLLALGLRRRPLESSPAGSAWGA